MILWVGGRLHLCKDHYAGGKRPDVTEHCLRGRPVKPRRAGQTINALQFLQSEPWINILTIRGIDGSMPSPFTFVLGVRSMTIRELQTGDRSRANYTAQVRDGSGARLDGGQGQS
jgi:hypothetical protein